MALDLKNEILSLRRGLLSMGAATEQRLDFSVRALLDGDVDAARVVKAGDNE
ncbi:MAG: hypothetical protein RI990_1191, partial [Planctomycetota bacterium]